MILVFLGQSSLFLGLLLADGGQKHNLEEKSSRQGHGVTDLQGTPFRVLLASLTHAFAPWIGRVCWWSPGLIGFSNGHKIFVDITITFNIARLRLTKIADSLPKPNPLTSGSTCGWRLGHTEKLLTVGIT
ncbi:hypothetical protein L596_006179 [Steinernema carpocapsae]|uniref:Secreted protein n=1 Tax=Steinernema carpocapsae TaxID=34508 RepID=A0A4U8V2S6_STECR|nr:hypothetical protein L596_006179 [Steinernema carpocapsae]